ncbi:MAG: hypothetical protein A3B86_02430 [Candidatus Yanofskybacteria bacterium RIFCSPHIGHO2_02_FULL_38_22b]|uniref:VWFA domain-containing protein n=1 Tax=Candidatus Yanofskybacteria bacterium RIFCSPHIGHO2_02_FULL_38_22b TaxID=1802673 RepID=A0A1F8F3G0_9BACT|nr:MAG: hypothetical protein A3B86_02430 [Candidatus Yanofskybacteria bacterium RIFCSPHIGHO2_02_FULL_38_22b]OGN20303.1 MAG: hypothetical protein A2910_03265 [Candidatus Yanofskybacteria bacterium RIFCSPLOWO2_01_FULL_39_28]
MEKIILEMLSFYEAVVLKLGIFLDLDLSAIRYGNVRLAVLVWYIIGALLLIKVAMLVFGRRKHSIMYSGHLIYPRTNFIKKAYFRLLYGLSFIGVAFFSIALAAPHLLSAGEEIRITQSRERIDFIDLSISMGWPYGEADMSLAEFARNYYLKFLEMRKSQNDRISIWVFSTEAYNIEGFSDDSELYFPKVRDAPYVLADPRHQCLPHSANDPNDACIDIVVSKERIGLWPGEGDTDIAGALMAGIRYFDENGRTSNRPRAILMITDLAASTYPELELREMQNRGIRPYVIYIANTNYSNSKEINSAIRQENTEKLKKTLASYGGVYFDINDKLAMEKAYRTIDHLEKIEEKEIKRTARMDIFQPFLISGLLVMFFALVLGLVSELVGTYP